MIVRGNTLTEEQIAAIERLRLDHQSYMPWDDLTLDMPSIAGGEAYVVAQPDWTDDAWYAKAYVINACGRVFRNGYDITEELA